MDAAEKRVAGQCTEIIKRIAAAEHKRCLHFLSDFSAHTMNLGGEASYSDSALAAVYCFEEVAVFAWGCCYSSSVGALSSRV
jgi:hypothetical protein